MAAVGRSGQQNFLTDYRDTEKGQVRGHDVSYLPVIRRMEGAFTKFLTLEGESGYIFLLQNQSGNILLIRSDIHPMSYKCRHFVYGFFIITYLKEMEAGCIIGKLLNLKYEMKYR